MVKHFRFLIALSLITVLLFSFLLPPTKIQGFWIYCETEAACDNVDEENYHAFMVFEESVCHAYVGLPVGLDPELLSTSTYQIINDSLYMYEKAGIFKSHLLFINDSTMRLTNDSNEYSFFRRMK